MLIPNYGHRILCTVMRSPVIFSRRENVMSSLGDRKREINMGDAVRRILEIAADGQREVSSWRDTAADPAAYEGIFERTAVNLRDAQKRLASERELAGARWESLASHPQPRRLVRIRND